MNREDVLLVALTAAGNKPMQPVHLQKTIFLIDRGLPQLFDDESKYDFTPYDYGPFDAAVYGDAELLKRAGLVTIEREASASYRVYRVTDAGRVKGELLLAALGMSIGDKICKVVQLVASLTFRELVAAIYKAYPEMKANSVFRG